MAPLLALLAIATSASAETQRVSGGSVSVDVAALQMSRLFVRGEKITAVRTLDDPSGPQLLLQNDVSTGDIFVGFSGDTAGRTFSLFATTDAGETIEVLLHPEDVAAKTVELLPEHQIVPGGAGAMTKTAGYSETLAAFMKLMFTGEVADGVTYTAAGAKAEINGHLGVQTLGYYRADGVRGIVLLVTNRDAVPQAISAEQFLVERVMAAGVTNERLQPGESAQVYIVEEVQ